MQLTVGQWITTCLCTGVIAAAGAVAVSDIVSPHHEATVPVVMQGADTANVTTSPTKAAPKPKHTAAKVSTAGTGTKVHVVKPKPKVVAPVKVVQQQAPAPAVQPNAAEQPAEEPAPSPTPSASATVQNTDQNTLPVVAETTGSEGVTRAPAFTVPPPTPTSHK